MSGKSKSIQLSSETIAEVREAVFALAETHLPESFYLIAVDFEKESGQWFLRLFLDHADRKTKVSLQDCETASRALDPHLETIRALKDFPYTLEVSSPGAFRALSTQREFEFYKGHCVKIERPDRANSKRIETTTGVITGADGNTLLLENQSVTLDEHTHVYLNPDIRLPEENSEESEISPNFSTNP